MSTAGGGSGSGSGVGTLEGLALGIGDGGLAEGNEGSSNYNNPGDTESSSRMMGTHHHSSRASLTAVGMIRGHERLLQLQVGLGGIYMFVCNQWHG